MNPFPFNDQGANFSKYDVDAVQFGKRRTCRGAIQLPVSLGTRPLDCRSLAPIEQPELDPCRVRETPHKAVQRIYFPHQMTLAESADGRVARHRSRVVRTHGDQRDLYTHPGGGRGSFQPGVARAYDQHIIMFHVKHLLADAEAGEDLIKVVIRRDASNHLTQAM